MSIKRSSTCIQEAAPCKVKEPGPKIPNSNRERSASGGVIIGVSSNVLTRRSLNISAPQDKEGRVLECALTLSKRGQY